MFSVEPSKGFLDVSVEFLGSVLARFVDLSVNGGHHNPQGRPLCGSYPVDYQGVLPGSPLDKNHMDRGLKNVGPFDGLL